MNLNTILATTMLAVLILLAIGFALSQRGFTWKTGLTCFGSACWITAALGFFGPFIASAGGLSWLPSTFEWPIGSASNVLVTSDGAHIVPHVPSGRVQIYDKHLGFQRGWFVESHGAGFKLAPDGDERVCVYFARSYVKRHYDLYGKRISSEPYLPRIYSRVADMGRRVRIPTPFYLLVFAHPLISWVVLVIGAVVVSILNRSGKERPDGAIQLNALRPTQITLFHVFWLVGVIVGGALGASLGSKYLGTIGIVTGGLIGLLLGHVVGALPDRLGTKLLFRTIQGSSNEGLWGVVNLGVGWNLYQTSALLQLAARGQDVSGQLPRIIGMLESDDELTRVYGWDALQPVFGKETGVVGDYNPRSSTEDCRTKVAGLKSTVERLPHE